MTIPCTATRGAVTCALRIDHAVYERVEGATALVRHVLPYHLGRTWAGNWRRWPATERHWIARLAAGPPASDSRPEDATP